MKRHASLDELADLGVGILRPRKAAQVEQHLAICTLCTQLNSQLEAVPPLLSGVQYPPIPANLSARIDIALASEVNLRQASTPATEAGRRDLPARSRTGGHGRPGRDRGGWRLPGLRGPAAKILTAAAGLVIIGGGGYLAATQLGGSQPASSSSARAPAGASGAASGTGESVGPRITYGASGSAHSIQTVTADTNFVPAKLSAQTVEAVQAARVKGVHAGPAHQVSALPNAHSSGAGNSGSGALPGGPQLEACVSAVTTGRSVLLVELARFEGTPATIIVAAATDLYRAEVWVVGPACSAANRDVLDHLKLAHT